MFTKKIVSEIKEARRFTDEEKRLLDWAEAVKFKILAQRFKLATNNIARNSARDIVPPEEWPVNNKGEPKFDDKFLAECDLLPTDLRYIMFEIYGLEKSMDKEIKNKIVDHKLWPFFEKVMGVDAVLAGKLLYFSKLGEIAENFPHWRKYWKYAGFGGDNWRTNKNYNHNIPHIMYNIGKSFKMLSSDNRKNDGKAISVYGQLYRDRKEYEMTKPACDEKTNPPKSYNRETGKPNWKDCTNQNRAQKVEDGTLICSKGHIDSKALRYANKAFLKDLWLYSNGDTPIYTQV